MGGESVARKLAAILYADVAGYSRLTGADEEGTHRTVAEHLDAMAEMISAHGGRVVHYAGDAVLADFASVVEAVRCAIEVQKNMAARNVDVPDERKVRFRIGVNLGDVIVDRDDIYGDGVNVTARLESLADPGGICVSRKVLDEVQGKIDVGFQDMGPQAVKNITEPVQTYRVVLEKPPAAMPPPPLPDKPSIAVLPFDIIGSDPAQDFFGDGIAEDIITGLSRFPSLFVIARNSSFSYKGQAIDVPQVARELGVRYVLEGSVRKARERIRISAQLIEAGTGNHLWVERYDRDLEDIFAIQDEVTDAIAAAIAPEIGHAERKRALRRQPESLDAWGLYQRGLVAYYQPTPKSLRSAVELFDKAGALDPNFAHAFAMAAEARYRVSRQDLRGDHQRLLAHAREQSRMAISLEPGDPLCLAVHGHVLSFSGQHEAAISTLKKSVALNPNDATAHHWLGRALTAAGRAEDAIVQHDLSLRLSPHDAYSASFYIMRAMALSVLGRYEECVQSARQATESPNPPGVWADAILAAGLSKLDFREEANAVLNEILQRAPDFTLKHVRQVFSRHKPDVMQQFVTLYREAGVPEE